MTIICVLNDPNHDCTWIGSDSLAIDSYGRKIKIESKFVVYGQWAVGVTGNMRLTDILANNADEMFHRLDGPNDFIDRLIAVMKRHDFDMSPASNSCAPNGGQELLLARAGYDPWVILGDFSVYSDGRFAAHGSGSDYAMGAYFGCRDIEKAIEAAIKYDSKCGGEVWIHRLVKPS